MFKTVKVFLSFVMFITLTPAIIYAQETFPSKPITIINPNPPGGFVDNVARALSISLQKSLKQPVLIVNKPGANGAIGHAFVANAAPDGYTLLITSPSLAAQPAIDQLFNRPPSYSLNKITPIAQITSDPAIILVNPDTGIKTIQEFIKKAGTAKDYLAISSSGTYGSTHLPMAMLENATGIKLKHIPTSGGAPAITLAIGGHVNALASAPSVAYPQVQANRLVPIAQTGNKRSAPFLDTPTLKESNINVEFALWTSLFAPANLPPQVQQQLTQAVREAVQDEQFKQAMVKGNSLLNYMDGDEFNNFWKSEIKKLQDTVKFIGKIED
jgi:tripartite-type tricarboxylate transporter receptor subunit TctC